MKAYIQEMEAKLRAIGETEGVEALRAAACEIFFASASLISAVSGVGELRRYVNALPEALAEAGVPIDELMSNPIRAPRQLLN